MILFRARMRLDPQQRAAVARSLCRVTGPTRALAGCLSSGLYTDAQDENVIVFAEEWADEPSLVSRLREDNMRVLLSALDCAADPPEVRFDRLSETRGIDFIAQCRGASSSP